MIEQGTPEWFDLRRGWCTGSRVKDVLAKTKNGISASRGNYLIELALQRITGEFPESFTSEAMQWGIDQESVARVKYEIKTKNFVDKATFIVHPEIPKFGASPDGLINLDGMIEIKNPNSATHIKYLKTKQAPKEYFIQMQAQLACAQREWNDFVSHDSRFPESSQMMIVRVYRDDKFIKEMENEVKQFLIEVDELTDFIRNGKF